MTCDYVPNGQFEIMSDEELKHYALEVRTYPERANKELIEEIIHRWEEDDDKYSTKD